MALRANIAYLAGEIAAKVIESVQAKREKAAVLGYPVDFGLQTWIAKSMMPEVYVQVYCATYLVTCR